jgi:hypothetical protein
MKNSNKTVNSMARGSMREDPKIPSLVKKFYLKYLYKFETLVPIKVHPCDWMQ